MSDDDDNADGSDDDDDDDGDDEFHSDGDDSRTSHGPYSPCSAPDDDADNVGQHSRMPDLGIADDMPSTGAKQEFMMMRIQYNNHKTYTLQPLTINEEAGTRCRCW